MYHLEIKFEQKINQEGFSVFATDGQTAPYNAPVDGILALLKIVLAYTCNNESQKRANIAALADWHGLKVEPK